MPRPYNWQAAHKRIGRGGVFNVRYRRFDGEIDCGIFRISGCTCVPNQRSYLVCADRWIPLDAVLSIRPYRDVL